MPDEILKRLGTLNNRLQQISANKAALDKQLEKLKEENTALLENEKQLQEQVRQLNEKVLLLKASAAPLNETDKKEFEKNLSEYIRTIDRCIAMFKD